MSFTFDPYKLRSGDVTTATTTPAEDILMTNPTACSELERYWMSLPRRRGVPQRKDVDPVAMAGLLEDSFILERVAPGVARIRVAGRNVTKLLGVEPRGLPLTAAFLPQARAAMGQHIEAAFTTPAIVELELEGPRAVGQPALQGKILMLPLRDDHGRVSRMLGVLVMSGRRGLGGRRFTISDTVEPRIIPIVGLRPVETVAKPALRSVMAETAAPYRPSLRTDTKKAGDKPALRLVVSNS